MVVSGSWRVDATECCGKAWRRVDFVGESPEKPREKVGTVLGECLEGRDSSKLIKL